MSTPTTLTILLFIFVHVFRPDDWSHTIFKKTIEGTVLGQIHDIDCYCPLKSVLVSYSEVEPIQHQAAV